MKGFPCPLFLSSQLHLKSGQSDALAVNLTLGKCSSYLSTWKAAVAQLGCVYVKFLPFSLPRIMLSLVRSYRHCFIVIGFSSS